MFKIPNNSYFTLTRHSSSGRIGELRINHKVTDTPSMYYQDSFPGGRGDVTRLISYRDLMNNQIPVLHNHHWLSNKGKFKTPSNLIIHENESMNEYILRLRNIFCGKTKDEDGKILNDPQISDQHIFNILTRNDWDPITLLDSGAGNFLLSSIEELYTQNQVAPQPEDVFVCFQALISEYFEFCGNHVFDVMMALDYAGKNTDKQWANRPELQKIANNLINNTGHQIHLLRESIGQLQSDKFDFAVFAPIHGETEEEIIDFTKRVLEMENDFNQKFDGFGLVPPKKPMERVRAVRAIRTTLEQHKDVRPIHALGAGAIRDIIPMVYAGVDMFDNATSWRRATDGSREFARNVNNPDADGSFSCFLIPLVNRNGDVITTNQENVLGYARLNKVDTNFSCDCDICNNFDMAKIKELYSNGTKRENFHFAKILCYNHAINQYDFICNRLRRDIEQDVDIMTLINEIPDKKYSSRTKKLIDAIDNFN